MEHELGLAAEADAELDARLAEVRFGATLRV